MMPALCGCPEPTVCKVTEDCAARRACCDGRCTNLAADPLPVTVLVTWTEGGHPGRTTSVSTLITRR